MRKFLKNLGPGILVSAAFIGPGTVTVCSMAGVNFGYSLLWALLISIIGCILLQEMSARVGLISGTGLSENIKAQLSNPILRNFSLILIFSAIVIGNAAYEAGNISGAALGLQGIFTDYSLSLGSFQLNLWSLLIGSVAFLLLFIGNYQKLEKVFIGLVLLMSISFIIAAILTKPDLSGMFSGFIPANFNESLLTIIALVGTTVVPYNLFLHASLVSEKWKNENDLQTVRKELIFSIGLGGIVSMAVLVCAASSGISNIQDAGDLAEGLKPLFGEAATIFLALGLLSAGITSSITAPLAAAYVVKGCLGWNSGLKNWKFRLVWMSIVILGIVFSSLGLKPVEVIQFAQVANGLVLPVIAIFLFWVVNRKAVMGEYRNSFLLNLFGILVIGLAIFLGVKSIYNVLSNLL